MTTGIFEKLLEGAVSAEPVRCADCKWHRADAHHAIFDLCVSPAVLAKNTEGWTELRQRGMRSVEDEMPRARCTLERRVYENFVTCGPHARFFEPRPLSWLERLRQRLRRVPV